MAGEEINISKSPNPGGVYFTDRDTEATLHIGAQNVAVENIVEAGQINVDGLAVLDGQLIAPSSKLQAPSLNVVQSDRCDESMHSDVMLTASLVSPSINCTKNIANTATGAISLSSGTLSLQPIPTEAPSGVFQPLVPVVALPAPDTAAAQVKTK